MSGATPTTRRSASADGSTALRFTASSVLARCRQDLERAEAELRTALPLSAEATLRLRDAEGELRRALSTAAAETELPASAFECLEQLRRVRAEWSERRQEAHRAAERAAADVTAARQALDAALEDVKRLSVQLTHEKDAAVVLRRSIVIAEQTLQRQRDALAVRDDAVAAVRRRLAELTDTCPA